MNLATIVVIAASCVSTWGLTYKSFPTATLKSANVVSQWNNDVGTSGLDNNATTCARTGHEFQSSLEVQLNVPVAIAALKVLGEGNLDNFKIDIGNRTTDGVKTERCTNWIAGPIQLQNPGTEFQCKVPITGDVITFETKEKSITPHQVAFCKILYA